MIHMRVKGESDFRELDVESIDELRPKMASVVGEAVDVVHMEMVRVISRPGPSAPGDPLATRSGEYVRSLKKSKPTGRAKRAQRGAVYTRLLWAPTHEFGGRVAGDRGRGLRLAVRIQARPTWRPVFERMEPVVDRMFREAL